MSRGTPGSPLQGRFLPGTGNMGIRLTPAGRLRWESSGDEAAPGVLRARRPRAPRNTRAPGGPLRGFAHAGPPIPLSPAVIPRASRFARVVRSGSTPHRDAACHARPTSSSNRSKPRVHAQRRGRARHPELHPAAGAVTPGGEVAQPEPGDLVPGDAPARRREPQALLVGLHPGPVPTYHSEPVQREAEAQQAEDPGGHGRQVEHHERRQRRRASPPPDTRQSESMAEGG